MLNPSSENDDFSTAYENQDDLLLLAEENNEAVAVELSKKFADGENRQIPIINPSVSTWIDNWYLPVLTVSKFFR